MRRYFLILAAAFVVLAPSQFVLAEEATPRQLTLVVMDPLCAPLACDCVQGYAQRDYDQLGKHISQRLKRPVKVVFSEALNLALKGKAEGKADIIIGKDSVVRFDLEKTGISASQTLVLTDKKGMTTQTGLLVVRNADEALSVADLKGYRIFFGPEDSAEKHQAALSLLKLHGVNKPKKVETCPACSDGAVKILELGAEVKAATVISSYAKPLLEGCGTIQKGDLRVIGETKPVPFISVFVNDAIDAETREQIAESLRGVAGDAKLRKALETKDGFIAPPKQTLSAKKKSR